MGGSDQWGNIVNGIDLGHRMGTPQLYALTSPLLTTSSGAKMGKSANGAVWLNADMLSALRFLAVLAQHRGRRCRPLPEALHHAAAGRDRPAGSARRLGDQRGQEGPGDRSDGDAAWPRGRRTGGRDRAQDLRGRRACRNACRPSRSTRPSLEAGIGHPVAVRHAPGSPRRTARPAATSRAAPCGSTTSRSATSAGVIGCGDLTPEGVDQAVARQEEARSGAAGLTGRSRLGSSVSSRPVWSDGSSLGTRRSTGKSPARSPTAG